MVIKKYYKGLPAISLASLDPMIIKEFKVKPNKGSNLNLRCTFHNAEVRGIKGAVAYDVKGFGKDMTETHSVSFKHPLVGLFGEYTSEGQLSVIPLKSHGQGNVNLSKRRSCSRFLRHLTYIFSWAGLDFVFQGKARSKIWKNLFKDDRIQVSGESYRQL